MVPTRDTNFDSGLYFKLLPCVRRPIPLFVEVSCGITSMTTDLHIIAHLVISKLEKPGRFTAESIGKFRGLKMGILQVKVTKK